MKILFKVKSIGSSGILVRGAIWGRNLRNWTKQKLIFRPIVLQALFLKSAQNSKAFWCIERPNRIKIDRVRVCDSRDNCQKSKIIMTHDRRADRAALMSGGVKVV